MTEKLDHIGIAVENLERVLAFYRGHAGHSSSRAPRAWRSRRSRWPSSPSATRRWSSWSPPIPRAPSASSSRRRDRASSTWPSGSRTSKPPLPDLKAKGVRLIDEKPRYGAGGARIAFLHPKATNGVLVELCQRD
ncbi:MAG: hypothetical protein MZU95_09110 [Desulfomicrobium escambiense]|nr:hypothetical protein [Desulfomicrobium escambiense]